MVKHVVPSSLISVYVTPLSPDQEDGQGLTFGIEPGNCPAKPPVYSPAKECLPFDLTVDVSGNKPLTNIFIKPVFGL